MVCVCLSFLYGCHFVLVITDNIGQYVWCTLWIMRNGDDGRRGLCTVTSAWLLVINAVKPTESMQGKNCKCHKMQKKDNISAFCHRPTKVLFIDVLED